MSLLNFIIVCMSYEANASMCNLKLIYPFIILYVVLHSMSKYLYALVNSYT